MPKKKTKKPVILAVAAVGAVAAAVIISWQVQARRGEAALARNSRGITSAQVEKSSIRTTVVGTGILADGEAQDIDAPSGLIIDQVLVESGDQVEEGQVLATLDTGSVKSAIKDIQASIVSVDDQLDALDGDGHEQWIKAPVSGKVKKINAAEGDDASAAMDAYGSLMLLSADGKMAVDTVNNGIFAKNSRVAVVLPDGQSIAGTVDFIGAETVTILVNDKSLHAGEAVAVMDENRTLRLGEGILYIHQPVEILSDSGEIEGIYVSENQTVEKGDDLVLLKNVKSDMTQEVLLAERESLQRALRRLRIYEKAGVITAPMSGIIQDVNVSEGGTIARASGGVAASMPSGLKDLSSLASISGFTMSAFSAEEPGGGFLADMKMDLDDLPPAENLGLSLNTEAAGNGHLLSVEADELFSDGTDEAFAAADRAGSEAADIPEPDYRENTGGQYEEQEVFEDVEQPVPYEYAEDEYDFPAVPEDYSPDGYSDAQEAAVDPALQELLNALLAAGQQTGPAPEEAQSIPQPSWNDAEQVPYPQEFPDAEIETPSNLADGGVIVYDEPTDLFTDAAPWPLPDAIRADGDEAENMPQQEETQETADIHWIQGIIALPVIAPADGAMPMTTEALDERLQELLAQNEAGGSYTAADLLWTTQTAFEAGSTCLAYVTLRSDTARGYYFPADVNRILIKADGSLASEFVLNDLDQDGKYEQLIAAIGYQVPARTSPGDNGQPQGSGGSEDQGSGGGDQVPGGNDQNIDYAELLRRLLEAAGTGSTDGTGTDYAAILRRLLEAADSGASGNIDYTALLRQLLNGGGSGTGGNGSSGNGSGNGTGGNGTGGNGSGGNVAGTGSTAGTPDYAALLRQLFGSTGTDSGGSSAGSGGTKPGSLLGALLGSAGSTDYASLLEMLTGNSTGALTGPLDMSSLMDNLMDGLSGLGDLSAMLGDMMSSAGSGSLSSLLGSLGGGSGMSSLLGSLGSLGSLGNLGSSGLSSLLGSLGGTGGASSLLSSLGQTGTSGSSGLSALTSALGSTGAAGSGTDYAALAKRLGLDSGALNGTSSLESLLGGSGALASAGALASSGSYTGGSAYADTPVFTISTDQTMELEISVNELDILSIALNQPAELTFDALEEESFLGLVSRIGKNGSNNGGVTKYPVTITLLRDPRMMNGMSATAAITIDEASDINVLPAEAIHEKMGQTYVYTEQGQDGTLQGEKAVVTGISDSDSVQITSGLSEGDMVYYQETTRGNMFPFSSGNNPWITQGADESDSV